MATVSKMERPLVTPSIEAENLSIGWLRALELVTGPGVSALAPLVVTVTGFSEDGVPEEASGVADLIDAALAEAATGEDDEAEGARRGVPPLTCGTVASTIFPLSVWNPARPRADLYTRYRALRPRMRRDPRNRRGMYFERMINYPDGPGDGNQLEHLFRIYEQGVTRKSAFQAAIAYPKHDLTSLPQQGFPCLQQIALNPDRRRRALAITAFYGTQYIFDRAYGNYLGLCRLGAFLAAEMGLHLERMTCVAGHARLGSISKTRARRLAADSLAVVRAAGLAT